MAGTFSPFGLRYDKSYSTSNNSTDGFREYELDPTYSGYAGDLAVPFLGMASMQQSPATGGGPDNGITINTRLSKYIYPSPIALPLNNGEDPVAEFVFQSFPPILGVFASFEYYPAALGGQLFRGAYYVQNTPLMPGTKVIAKVICDPNANYDVQYKTYGANTSGLVQNNLFDAGFLFCDTGYYRTFQFQNTVPGTYTTQQMYFPIGNENGSLSYFAFGSAFLTYTPTQTTPPIVGNPIPSTVAKGWTNNSSLLITGLAKYQDNQWADPTNNILAPNNIAQVKLLLGFTQMFASSCGN